MMHRKTVLVLIIPILVLATPLNAAEQPDPTGQPAVDETAEQPVSLLNLSPEKVARLAPLQAELRQILLDERARLEPLLAAFAKETDSLRGFVIQRQIRDVKIGTEIALMRTQAEHARLNGRPEVAERIEEGLRRMAERVSSTAQDRSVRPSRPGAER